MAGRQVEIQGTEQHGIEIYDYVRNRSAINAGIENGIVSLSSKDTRDAPAERANAVRASTSESANQRGYLLSRITTHTPRNPAGEAAFC